MPSNVSFMYVQIRHSYRRKWHYLGHPRVSHPFFCFPKVYVRNPKRRVVGLGSIDAETQLPNAEDCICTIKAPCNQYMDLYILSISVELNQTANRATGCRYEGFFLRS